MAIDVPLREIAAALNDVNQDAERAAVFVESHNLGAAGEGPERQVIRALADEVWARVAIEGPAGSGKTSLLVHALARMPSFTHVSLVVRVRVGKKDLQPDELIATVLAELEEMLRLHGADTDLPTLGKGIDLTRLANAAANTNTVTQPGASVATQLTVNVPLVRGAITRTVYDATTSAQSTPTDSARLRALNEALQALSSENARLVVVVDDTEHFASGNNPIQDDDAKGVRALYAAVTRLADLPLQIVLAVHPRFREVDKAQDVLERSGFTTVPVAVLAADNPKGLIAIIDRRLQRAGLAVTASDVFGTDAIAQLKAIYHEAGRHNLRYVLRIARRACTNAEDLSVQTRIKVVSTHINAALEAERG